MPLSPDQSMLDSSPWNNPVLAPFLNVPNDQQIMLGSVPETAAIGSEFLPTNYTPQGPRNMLMDLRAKFPWLPIIPPSTKAFTSALSAGVVQRIYIPSGIIAGMFLCSGPCFTSFGGNAAVPVNGAAPIDNATIFAPNNVMIYLAGVQELSFVAPYDNTYISLAMYSAEELPR